MNISLRPKTWQLSENAWGPNLLADPHRSKGLAPRVLAAATKN
jgi:hypothetical protein